MLGGSAHSFEYGDTEARLAEWNWNSRRLRSYKGGLFSMLVRKWMKHFQVAVTAGFDAKTIPGSINCYIAKMSQFRQQLRGHMVGPPCWLTSYLNLTSLHPEVELSRTSHYHQRIISRHRKTSKKTYSEKVPFFWNRLQLDPGIAEF